jgi:hypothetical protein
MKKRSFQKVSKKTGLQLFATSWLSLGKAETPVTADKRETKDFPKSLQVGNSFIHKTLYNITPLRHIRKYKNTEIIVNYGV